MLMTKLRSYILVRRHLQQENTAGASMVLKIECIKQINKKQETLRNVHFRNLCKISKFSYLF
jgi:hypothetical protein